MPTALRPRKTPSQDRSAATVEAIVEAAIRILRQEGWAACTTTRVAGLAGVSVGSLYQYFPNRAAIAVEIVRRRTRRYLSVVIDADFAKATDIEGAIRLAMEAFLAEKRTGLDLSLALRDALPEVQGRQAIIEEARNYVPALKAKLAATAGTVPEGAQLAVAMAAVDGTVWEMLAQDPSVLEKPQAAVALAKVFIAAAGLDPGRTRP